LYVVEGELEEYNFIQNSDDSLTLVNKELLMPPEVSYINDRIGLHKLRNSAFGRTMSLHLYAKPIDRCDYYCDKQEDFINKELSYDTYRVVEKST